MTSGSLWNFHRDEIDYIDATDNASDGKSFEHKKNSRQNTKTTWK